MSVLPGHQPHARVGDLFYAYVNREENKCHAFFRKADSQNLHLKPQKRVPDHDRDRWSGNVDRIGKMRFDSCEGPLATRGMQGEQCRSGRPKKIDIENLLLT